MRFVHAPSELTCSGIVMQIALVSVPSKLEFIFARKGEPNVPRDNNGDKILII